MTKREIAQRFRFPDLQYGEDWGWCKQLCEVARTEIQIPKDLYFYRYSDSVTRAK